MISDIFQLLFPGGSCIMHSVFPGIAQLVGRVLWEHQAARSSRATRTKSPGSASAESGLFCLQGTRNAAQIRIAADSRLPLMLYMCFTPRTREFVLSH